MKIDLDKLKANGPSGVLNDALLLSRAQLEEIIAGAIAESRPPAEPTNEMLEAAVRECKDMVDARFASGWNLYTLIWTTMYRASKRK